MDVKSNMKYSFMRFPAFKDKAVTLSYDDGVIYDEKLIQIMSSNGLKGTFNINSGMFSADENSRRLTKTSAKGLYLKSGNEIAVHGYKHLALAEVDSAMATNDILQDRLELEKLFGTIVKGMAYAYGSYDDKTVEILKSCGVDFARTTISTEKFDIPTDWLRLCPTCHHKNPRLMELAKEFIEINPTRNQWVKRPKIFYLWGHSYEFNDDNNWGIFEEFSKYIGNRNDVWYATNGEIYDYVKAFESLKFSADGTTIYNPSGIEIYLNYFDKDCSVKPNETIKIAK